MTEDLIFKLELYDCILNNIVISPATPKIITQTIPYTDKVFDFSRITGDYNYEPRTIKATFTLTNDDVRELTKIYTQIKNMILGTYKTFAIREKYFIPEDYYNSYGNVNSGTRAPTEGSYFGIVTGIEEDEDYGRLVKFTITLRCYPYKIANYIDAIKFDGNKINYNFDMIDIVHEYTISNEETIILHGDEGQRPYIPIFKSDSKMKLTLNNDYTINIFPGVTRDENFIFNTDSNTILVKGTGNLKIGLIREYL